MNFVRESDPRPHRQVRVEVLSLEPLTAVPPLHIADRDIVRAGVPENMVHRGTGASSRAFFDWHPTAAGARGDPADAYVTSPTQPVPSIPGAGRSSGHAA